jgi:hypothetical protein
VIAVNAKMMTMMSNEWLFGIGVVIMLVLVLPLTIGM